MENHPSTTMTAGKIITDPRRLARSEKLTGQRDIRYRLDNAVEFWGVKA